MAALELASDYDMPVTGDLWTDIRELKIPIEITTGNKENDQLRNFVFFHDLVLTDLELKDLLIRMIHTDYKLRPSAKEVLDSPTIRNQVCFNKSEIHRFHL